MSLYVQIAVGAGLYLLDASRVVEIREDMRGGEDSVDWQGIAVPVVDLRELFAETDGAYGSSILFAQTSGEPAALIVDRVDGLVELADPELCPLPPIGPLGLLVDAVSTRSADPRPLLRLRGERALATAAALG